MWLSWFELSLNIKNPHDNPHKKTHIFFHVQSMKLKDVSFHIAGDCYFPYVPFIAKN